MNKTYADECLERAEKASHAFNLSTDGIHIYYEVHSGTASHQLTYAKNHIEFCERSRTDMSELARRLNEAIRLLKQLKCHPDCIKVLESKPGEEILVTVTPGHSVTVQLTLPEETEISPLPDAWKDRP